MISHSETILVAPAMDQSLSSDEGTKPSADIIPFRRPGLEVPPRPQTPEPPEDDNDDGGPSAA